MNAEIIAVGTELLLGQIANTNGQFLSKHLAQLGINVYYHTVVGDNGERLTNAINIAKERANVIIIMGGLGPTKDDITKDTVAKMFHKQLVYDQDALHNIESFFQKKNVQISESNKRQALVIEGATVFPNDHGLAPGMALSEGSIIYILLPGPPREIEPMTTRYVKPFLSKYLAEKEIIHSRVLRFFNIGESTIEDKLSDLIDTQSNPTIAPLAHDGEVTIRLTAKARNKSEALKMIDEVEQIIMERVGSKFYGYDETSLMEQVKNVLMEKNLTIAAAESLTGGLFSEQLTSFPNVSKIFQGSVISYSNFVKEKVLQVSAETIEKFGVVSEQCAIEMAEGVKRLCETQIGISFTGVAGPTMQEGKEVGTVFIGISILNEPPLVIPLKLRGSREQIRMRTIKNGCFHLLKQLKRWN